MKREDERFVFQGFQFDCSFRVFLTIIRSSCEQYKLGREALYELRGRRCFILDLYLLLLLLLVLLLLPVLFFGCSVRNGPSASQALGILFFMTLVSGLSVS